MSSYLFFGSFSLGLIYSQVCDNDKFINLYHGIYRPHADHRRRVRECLKSGGALDFNYYRLYFFDAFFSPFLMIYSFLFKYKNDLKIYKQQMIYDLIEKFEFVNETIDNFDEIETLMKDKLSKPLANSYSNMSIMQKSDTYYSQEKILKDKLNMLKFLSDRDENTSEYEKQVLANPIIDNSDLPPEEKYKAFVNSLEQKKMLKDIIEEESYNFHNKSNEDLEKYYMEKDRPKITPSVFEDEETKKKRLEHEKMMKKVIESQDPTEIDNIKKIFGNEDERKNA